MDEPTGISTSATTDLGSLDSPHQPTSYKYDAYGKMVEVKQGDQKRWFKYDSLGRLLRVRQPEQEINQSLDMADAFNTSADWTAGFAYDIVGNVFRATDANGVNIINEYDKASRVTKRCYTKPNISTTATSCAGIGAPNLSTDTPTVSFYYDGKGLAQQQTPHNFAKGKLTKVISSVSETQYQLFDNFGRLTQSSQITDGLTYTSGYQYSLSGALTQETYPSGRIVKNEFEPDGDLLAVKGKKAGASNFSLYASEFSYTASGGISQMRLGNGKWETARFNDRLQVEELGLGYSVANAGLWRVNYAYGELPSNGSVDATKNTGNIAKQTLTIPGATFVQNYKYDSLYRLKEAVEPGSGSTPNWTQTFDYDRYGNRTAFTQTVGGVTTHNSTPAVSNGVSGTNRFTSTNFEYDKNGNLVGDVDPYTSQSRDFLFNADNKQREVIVNGASVGSYFYDGEGKRVKKVVGNETTVFVYSSGKLVAEYSTATPPEIGHISYTTTDHLGSPRIITNELGQVQSRRDFMPFGEDLNAGVGNRTAGQKYSAPGDPVRQKFTGYQKDEETKLDFAEARMYENRHGRFTTVDPLLASGKSANPQTFNRFVYVGGNPMNITDPSGLIWYYNKSLGRYDWYDEETKKFKFGGGGLTDEWSLVTEGVGSGNFIYKNSSGNFTTLDPNSDYFKSFFTVESAIWEYGAHTNYGGSGNIPVWGTFVLPMLSGIKTGNVERAMYGFWGTAATLATAPRTIGGILKEGASEAFSAISGLPIFNFRKPLSNEELVQKAANIAHKRTDDVGRFAGQFKHEYATKLLERHQRRFGDNGLRFKQYFNNGPGNRGFLDVFDTKNNVIYDWKFVNPSVSTQTIQKSAQIQKYERNFGVPVNIVRPEQW